MNGTGDPYDYYKQGSEGKDTMVYYDKNESGGAGTKVKYYDNNYKEKADLSTDWQ